MMQSEVISENVNAPVLVLFGGNPHRRDDVIKLLCSFGDMSIYGALSEAEGMDKLQSLPKVDLVMIGSRYPEKQRIRIRKYIIENLPRTKISEPGWNYPYENEAIKNDIIQQLKIR